MFNHCSIMHERSSSIGRTVSIVLRHTLIPFFIGEAHLASICASVATLCLDKQSDITVTQLNTHTQACTDLQSPSFHCTSPANVLHTLTIHALKTNTWNIPSYLGPHLPLLLTLRSAETHTGLVMLAKLRRTVTDHEMQKKTKEYN